MVLVVLPPLSDVAQVQLFKLVTCLMEGLCKLIHFGHLAFQLVVLLTNSLEGHPPGIHHVVKLLVLLVLWHVDVLIVLLEVVLSLLVQSFLILIQLLFGLLHTLLHTCHVRFHSVKLFHLFIE